MSAIRPGDGHRSRLLSSASVAALGALAVTAVLAGCRDRLDDHTAVKLANPEMRHPITFSARQETLEVEVVGASVGLSQSQEADVYRFIDRYRAEARGPIAISAPTAGKGQAAARRTVEQIRQMLADADVPRRAVVVQRHGDERRFASAVRVSYERPVAVPPTCGDWSSDLGLERERVHPPDFGCATQHNTAVMVANPRDLLHPQEEDPRSSERRGVAWGQYTASVGGGGGGGASAGAAPAGDGGSKGKPAAIK